MLFYICFKLTSRHYVSPENGNAAPVKVTGTWTADAQGNWSFASSDGAAKDGWYYLNTTNKATDYNWFCFDANGVMKTGWIQDKSDPTVWYYTGETKDSSEGGMVKGWATDPRDGKRYYLDPSTGIMCYGWKQIGNVWYYFGEKQYSNASHPYGSMYVNEKTPDGYYVGSNGGWTQNHSEENSSDHDDPAPKSYYTVTFNLQGHGTPIDPLSNVTSGSKISAPTAPTAEGYTFGGWYKEAACTNGWKFDSDTVRSNTTLYANWKANKYNVTPQVQGSHGTATVKVGDAEPTSETTQAVKGTNLVFTATPADGYEFDRWEVVSGGIDIESVKNNAAITVTMPETALTLKAHFNEAVPSAYGIIVEGDGHGTAKAQVGDVDVTSAAPGTTVTLVAAPNDGYQFKEWNVVSGGVTVTDNKFTMPASNVTVKAVFEEIPNYLCFTSEGDTSTVKLMYQKYDGDIDVSLQTSTDGTDWTDYTIGSEISLNNGDKIFFKATTENETFSSEETGKYYFVMTGSIAASGSIMSLLDSDCDSTEPLKEICFMGLFSGCNSLTTAPELPAESLAFGCYMQMFADCTNLKTAPELPATKLAEHCYEGMFTNCTNLETAPELPATKLAKSCYEGMFFKCSKLSKITMLAEDISAEHCLSKWVISVASNGTFIKAKAMTNLPAGENGIPGGWTVKDYEASSMLSSSPVSVDRNIEIIENTEPDAQETNAMNEIPDAQSVVYDEIAAPVANEVTVIEEVTEIKEETD